jgi:hypothetical protein
MSPKVGTQRASRAVEILFETTTGELPSLYHPSEYWEGVLSFWFGSFRQLALTSQDVGLLVGQAARDVGKPWWWCWVLVHWLKELRSQRHQFTETLTFSEQCA